MASKVQGLFSKYGYFREHRQKKSFFSICTVEGLKKKENNTTYTFKFHSYRPSRN